MKHAPLHARVHSGEAFTVTHEFDAAEITEFATRSGDANPMHREHAGALRFGKRIASAQHTISMMIGLAATWLAQRGTAIALGCSFRFTAAVLEDDSLQLSWTVAQCASKESLGGIVIVLEGTATNQSGRECVRGTLEMLLQE